MDIERRIMMGLWEAIEKNDIKATKKILATGIDVNVQNNLGQTYLMLALQHKRGAIVDMLLENSNVSILDCQNRNALFYVQSMSQAKKLIGKKINVNIIDKKGKKATDVIQDPKIVTIINQQRQKIQDKLELAVKNNESRKTRALLKMGADVNWRYSKYQETALIIASRLCHGEVADILIKAGADVNAKDTEGGTALSYGVERGVPKLALVNNLVNAGATFDDPHTVILCAVFGNMETLRLMAKIGVDFDSQDKKGMTILMYAVESGSMDRVQFLIDNHANPLLKNNKGQSALDIALSKMRPSNFIATIQKYTKSWETEEQAKDNEKLYTNLDINFM